MYLVRQGSAQLQGYLISRPVVPERIAEMLPVALLPPIEDPRWVALESAVGVASGEPALEDLVRGLLVELQRLTGLDSVYLTRIDWDRGEQEVLFSRNAGSITVPERLILKWPDTLFRSTPTDGPHYAARTPEEFLHSWAATALGLQTSVKVPVLVGGSIFGTLCGASGRSVPAGDARARGDADLRQPHRRPDRRPDGGAAGVSPRQAPASGHNLRVSGAPVWAAPPQTRNH
jgi:hypothetical protein